MYPILLTAAASVAGDVIRNISERFSGHTAKAAPTTAAPSVPFSTLVDRATPATASTLAGPATAAATATAPTLTVPTAALAARRTIELTRQLSHSPEVAAAMNSAGLSGRVQLQIEGSGQVSLRSVDGKTTPVQFSPEMRSAARELYQLRQPTTDSAMAARRLGPVVVGLA